MNLGLLNPAQREAVLAPDGPVLVLAGAGTGKTRVIAFRIARLISRGVPPASILAVTFTNKAAREMAERVRDLLPGGAGPQVTIGTFHSFCNRLLHRYADRLGFSLRFGIATQAYQVGLVRNLMSELGLQDEDGGAQEILAAISRAKSRLQTPAELESEPNAAPRLRRAAEVYQLYQQRLRTMDLMDFDDLLAQVLRLWESHPEVLATSRQQYRQVLVDEYQDTNQVQFRLVAALAGRNGSVCVVGDDDQSIYGWRGADISNILQFESHFPGARIVRLEQNYRSTATILAAANRVIANNGARHAKSLWSTRDQGRRLQMIHVNQEEDEGRLLVELLREKQMLDRRQYRDFAVLYRSNHQSRVFEQALRQSRVPHQVVGSHSFYDRKEVMDAVSLLQLVANPKDDLSFLRVVNVPPRGVGDKSVTRLKEWQRMMGCPLTQLLDSSEVLAELPGEAAEGLQRFQACLRAHRDQLTQAGQLASKVANFLDQVGYLGGLGRMYKPREDALRRRENVDEFISAVAAFEADAAPGANLHDFLQSLSLLDDNDRSEREGKKDDNAVTLMTVHAAKGLEFPVVFVVGLEQGLFPHHQAIADQALEEERRLFYVALTRAREEVVLSYALHRRVKGLSSPRRPSVFLGELPPELVEACSHQEALRPAPPEVAAEYLARMKAMFAPPAAKASAPTAPKPP